VDLELAAHYPGPGAQAPEQLDAVVPLARHHHLEPHVELSGMFGQDAERGHELKRPPEMPGHPPVPPRGLVVAQGDLLQHAHRLHRAPAHLLLLAHGQQTAEQLFPRRELPQDATPREALTGNARRQEKPPGLAGTGLRDPARQETGR